MNTNLFNMIEVAEVKLSYQSKEKPSDRPKITNSQDAHRILRPWFEDEGIEHHEAMFMLLLNRANCVVGCFKVSQGGIAGTAVDPKIIFQSAILANAAGFILAHNHPSGNLKPSESDLAITKRIKDLGKMLECTLMDHMILSPESGKYYSMADEGVM